MIVRNGKNFLTRDAADQYYTIGGTSLVGEKTHETVLRETLEEVGIRAKVNQLALWLRIILISMMFSGIILNFIIWQAP